MCNPVLVLFIFTLYITLPCCYGFLIVFSAYTHLHIWFSCFYPIVPVRFCQFVSRLVLLYMSVFYSYYFYAWFFRPCPLISAFSCLPCLFLGCLTNSCLLCLSMCFLPLTPLWFGCIRPTYTRVESSKVFSWTFI